MWIHPWMFMFVHCSCLYGGSCSVNSISLDTRNGDIWIADYINSMYDLLLSSCCPFVVVYLLVFPVCNNTLLLSAVMSLCLFSVCFNLLYFDMLAPCHQGMQQTNTCDFYWCNDYRLRKVTPSSQLVSTLYTYPGSPGLFGVLFVP